MLLEYRFEICRDDGDDHKDVDPTIATRTPFAIPEKSRIWSVKIIFFSIHFQKCSSYSRNDEKTVKYNKKSHEVTFFCYKFLLLRYWQRNVLEPFYKNLTFATRVCTPWGRGKKTFQKAPTTYYTLKSLKKHEIPH